MRGVTTEGNFILADFATAERAKCADAFLRCRGIIVRGMAAYDLPHCLRITVGTGRGMHAWSGKRWRRSWPPADHGSQDA